VHPTGERDALATPALKLASFRGHSITSLASCAPPSSQWWLDIDWCIEYPTAGWHCTANPAWGFAKYAKDPPSANYLAKQNYKVLGVASNGLPKTRIALSNPASGRWMGFAAMGSTMQGAFYKRVTNGTSLDGKGTSFGAYPDGTDFSKWGNPNCPGWGNVFMDATPCVEWPTPKGGSIQYCPNPCTDIQVSPHLQFL